MQHMIKSIKYYDCGSCTNNLALIFKHHPFQKRQFPAAVFLIHHQTQGYILYDTGYSPTIYQKTPLLMLYRLLNPTDIREEQVIDQQLKRDGIPLEAITQIVLSHLHPDHIGALKRFPNAKLILSEDAYVQYQNKKISDLILTQFLPEDFLKRLVVIKPDKINEAFPYRKTYDLFGDQSMLLPSFNGHAQGQLGIFFKERQLLIAADVCWGVDLLDKVQDMRYFAKIIQHDMNEYQQSVACIQKMIADNIQVVVSHDSKERVQQYLL